MSLIIKGMEMPESCALCDLEHWDEDTYGYEFNYRCAMFYKGYTSEVRENGRLPDCPLVPLPEKHGRLIDADAFAETVQQAIGTKGGEAFILDLIDEAATIVPAEGGGEDG